MCVCALNVHHSLVKNRSVRVTILLYNGNYQCDEFGPEVQILDARALFFWRIFFLILKYRREAQSEATHTHTHTQRSKFSPNPYKNTVFSETLSDIITLADCISL